MFFLGICPT